MTKESERLAADVEKRLTLFEDDSRPGWSEKSREFRIKVIAEAFDAHALKAAEKVRDECFKLALANTTSFGVHEKVIAKGIEAINLKKIVEEI